MGNRKFVHRNIISDFSPYESYITRINPCKPKGGHKIFATLSLSFFSHPAFWEKDGRRNFPGETFPIEKKIEKNIWGSPEPSNLAKIKKKIFPKNINLPVYWHFTIWKYKINLKVDSESLDIYLTPCKKAKR